MRVIPFPVGARLRPRPLVSIEVTGPALATSRVSIDMNETYRPITLSAPVQLACGLCMHSAAANAELSAFHLSQLVDHWIVSLDMNQQVLARLMQLWNVVRAAGADEISDWSLPATCKVTSRDHAPVPSLLGVTCTVYANGEVSFAITADGIDPALWFDESLDLHDYVAPAEVCHVLEGATA